MKTFIEKYRTLIGSMAIVAGGLLIYLYLNPPADTSSLHSHDAGLETHGSHGTVTQAELWTCSMHPQIRHDKPGACPICGMPLVPVTGQAANKLAVETDIVRRQPLNREIRAVGKLAVDETRLGYITARVGGRVDRLYVGFVGAPVRRNDPLAEIYSPELLVAQRELLLAASRPGASGQLLELARTKLRLWGLLPAQISEIEASGQPRTHITLFAPQAGTVIERNVLEGQYVKEGDVLFQIADLSTLWLNLDIYESDLSWIRTGQTVDINVESYPGEWFSGTVAFITPMMDDATRTVRVRVNVSNPDGRMKPLMYASAVIRVPWKSGTEKLPLAVRASAVLDTGTRKVVYRQTPDGNFEPVDVKLGPLSLGDDAQSRPGRYYPVIDGLGEGDEVAVRGAYLIDSQRQIDGSPSLLYPEGHGGTHDHSHHGH
ncbi:MAG: efflux RND transporter periplasmic adaptor subunit [Deltaproteobacteria bacterium]|nr:efflux RND transporter periplasmic adaptor subunit [Deltaproteobacteria bacterium]